jgi:hypothetical protein
MYSRKLAVEEKKNKKRAIYFSFLTIVLILFMFFYGLPGLVKLASFVYDLKKSGEPVESSDTTPPPPPRISTMPPYTKDKDIQISGASEAGSTVTIKIDGHSDIEVTADSEGKFSQTYSLSEGENLFSFVAKDKAGNKSQETKVYKVILDKKAPEVSISSPSDGQSFTGSSNSQLSVNGKTEAEVRVQVNGRYAIVNSDGSFSITIGLLQGLNIITVKVTDLAGNSTEKVLSVNYSS